MLRASCFAQTSEESHSLHASTPPPHVSLLEAAFWLGVAAYDPLLLFIFEQAQRASKEWNDLQVKLLWIILLSFHPTGVFFCLLWRPEPDQEYGMLFCPEARVSYI